MTIPDILTEYLDALNAHDPDRAASTYTEDASVEQAILNGLTFTGREKIAGWVRDNLAGLPDLRVEAVSSTLDGDTLVWEWVYTGTYTGSFPGSTEGQGQAVSLRGVSVMTLAGDVIASETLYYDNLSFLTQIDAAEQPSAK